MSVASEVRSFVDLRAFAASADVPSGGDYRTARTALPLAEGPCSVDLLALDGGAGSDTGLPGDEFVIVLAGSLRLGDVPLAVDACAMIPSGVAFDWQAAPGTRALAMRYLIDMPAAQRIVPIDESAELAPSNPPLAELLPDYRAHGAGATHMRNAEIVRRAGLVLLVWDGTSKGTLSSARAAAKLGRRCEWLAVAAPSAAPVAGGLGL